MEKIFKNRKIDRLYHFTQAKNLANIFEYGLLPRETLERESISSSFNDANRFDKCLNAVCMSLEFPNYRMFYKLRQDNPDVDWTVLRLDVKILSNFKCAFCWTNAGDATMFNTSLTERMGKEAFLELFENRPSYPRREDLNIADWFPTNPQAEILVFNTIPAKYIKNVFFDKQQILDKYKNIIPNNVDARVNTTYFKYRADYEKWKI